MNYAMRLNTTIPDSAYADDDTHAAAIQRRQVTESPTAHPRPCNMVKGYSGNNTIAKEYEIIPRSPTHVYESLSSAAIFK